MIKLALLATTTIFCCFWGRAFAEVALVLERVEITSPHRVAVRFTIRNESPVPVCIDKNILFQMQYWETGILFGTDSNGNQLQQPSAGLNFHDGEEIVSDLESRFSIIQPNTSVTSVILEDGLGISDSTKDYSNGIRTLQIVFPYLECSIGEVVVLHGGTIPTVDVIRNRNSVWKIAESNVWNNPYLDD